MRIVYNKSTTQILDEGIRPIVGSQRYNDIVRSGANLQLERIVILRKKKVLT